MEGMYVKQTLHGVAPHILVSAIRPAGRQAMTAAHELGHHVFGHGTHIDQYVKGIGTIGCTVSPTSLGSDSSANCFEPEEFLADAFGAFFLMPKSAVERGFATRGLAASTSTPLEVFSVAGWLGVGYTTLVHHMCSSLKLISWARAQELITAKPKALRERVVGQSFSEDVYIVDAAWTGRPLDLKLGDVAIVPTQTSVEPTTGRFSSAPRSAPGLITSTASGLTMFASTGVGVGRLVGTDWAVFVRVAAREYAGRNLYRHFEDDSTDDAVSS
jgi:hypothetical protein